MPSDRNVPGVGVSPVFDGRFSDGRTAVSRPVRVTLTASTLEIDLGDGAPALVWPLAGLETAEPITRSAIDVLVHEPGRAGGTLFVPEGTFARLLAARTPHLTVGAQRWRFARTWVWLTAGAAAVAAIVAFTEISPARAIARLLPDKTRVALGRQVILSMSGGHPFCSSADGTAALTALTRRLAAATGSSKTFAVKVADSTVVNAFAAPGEQIVIMRGVLDKAETADEVAAVLAHEMGHGLELDPEAGIIRIVGLTAITEFVLGGSGGTIANIGLLLTQNSYTRQAERAADHHALETLRSAHISPRGFAAFFRRIAKVYGESTDRKSGPDAGDFAADIFRTHPSTAERLAAIEAVEPYSATPALDEVSWRALKGICGKSTQVVPGTSPQPAPRPKTVPRAPPARPQPPSPGQRDI